jgi:hypothetical protein
MAKFQETLFWGTLIVMGILLFFLILVPILFSMNWMMFIVLAIITACLVPLLTVGVFGEKGMGPMFFLVLFGFLISAVISAESPRFWQRHVEVHDPIKKEKKAICNYELRPFVDHWNKRTSGNNRINCD